MRFIVFVEMGCQMDDCGTRSSRMNPNSFVDTSEHLSSPSRIRVLYILCWLCTDSRIFMPGHKLVLRSPALSFRPFILSFLLFDLSSVLLLFRFVHALFCGLEDWRLHGVGSRIEPVLVSQSWCPNPRSMIYMIPLRPRV